MRSHTLALFVILTVTLLTPQVFALGISPSRTIIDFEPGLRRTLQFYALNTQNQELNLEVYVSGPLAEYMAPSATSLHLSPSESFKTFTVDMELPQTLERPGILDTRVGIVEAIPQAAREGAAVIARIGVESQLWIRVPYPGIYAEISLETEDVAVGEDVEFKLNIANRGTQPITAQGEIRVYDNDSMVASLDAGSVYLESKQSESLEAVWSTQGFGSGVYRAVATVKYDGQSKETEKTFRVGALTVDLVDVYTTSVFPGEVARMVLELKSFWNKPITGTYAELEILDRENVLAKSKSETFDIDAWENKNITIYVDTENLRLGKYDARITYHYADQSSTRKFEDRLEIASLSYELYLYLAAAVIIAIALLLFLKGRKKWRIKLNSFKFKF